tara:strand:+ start:429 stop:1238 length:810 start_codon:yes stop_codon:yes gene_type:complete
MGKSKDSWQEMFGLEKTKNSKEYAKLLGVDYDSFQEDNRDGNGAFDQKGLDEALSKAANNRFDFRDSMLSAKAAGVEGADELPNAISNMDEFRQTLGFLTKTGADELGQNKTSSRNDFGNITKHFRGLEQDALDSKLNQPAELPSSSGEATKQEPYVPSERMQAANDFVKQYELQLRDPGFNTFSTGNGADVRSDVIFDTRAAELGGERSDQVGSNELVDTINTSPLDTTSVQKNQAIDLKNNYASKIKDELNKNNVVTSNFGVTMGLA